MLSWFLLCFLCRPLGGELSPATLRGPIALKPTNLNPSQRRWIKPRRLRRSLLRQLTTLPPGPSLLALPVYDMAIRVSTGSTTVLQGLYCAQRVAIEFRIPIWVLRLLEIWFQGLGQAFILLRPFASGVQAIRVQRCSGSILRVSGLDLLLEDCGFVPWGFSERVPALKL